MKKAHVFITVLVQHISQSITEDVDIIFQCFLLKKDLIFFIDEIWKGRKPSSCEKGLCIILKTEVMEVAFPIHLMHLSCNFFFFNFAEEIATWSRQRKVLTQSAIWLLWNKFLSISVEMYCTSIWQYYCCTNRTILHVVIAIKVLV